MKSEPNPSVPECHHCGSSDLRFAEGYETASRVTSDCKPWPAGGVLALCRTCGLVQTLVSQQWQMESEQIYTGYTIYHQSGGIEQTTFNSASGASHARSGTIIKALIPHVRLPAVGRWLDIGCGNGAMLRACSRALAGWSFCGSEVNDKYRNVIESIPGVERLFTEPIARIPGSFDVISLIHVIEHIPNPKTFLRVLATKLKSDGLLLLEVPDCRQNFFSLMTADHCSHFSTRMLANVVSSAGYAVLQAADTWVAKEVTLVARAAGTSELPGSASAPMQESEQIFQGWKTLQGVLAQVESLARAGEFGIFGTSIAATWLDSNAGRAAAFFVDEDPNRIGKQHFGRRIISPSEIPDGASVFIALPRSIAVAVAERLRMINLTSRFVTP